MQRPTVLAHCALLSSLHLATAASSPGGTGGGAYEYPSPPGDAGEANQAAEGGGEGGGEGGSKKMNRIIIAHAVLGTVAFLALMPAALLAGRWLRRFGWWVRVHKAFNVVAAAAIIAAFGTGYYHIGHDHWQGYHQRAGLALLILVLLQAIVGLVAHLTTHPVDPGMPTSTQLTTPTPTLTRRKPLLRLFHIATGIVIFGFGLAQLTTGIALWRQAIHFYTLPSYLYGILWAVAGVGILAYLAGWTYEAAQVRRARRAALVDEGVEGETGQEVGFGEQGRFAYGGERVMTRESEGGMTMVDSPVAHKWKNEGVAPGGV